MVLTVLLIVAAVTVVVGVVLASVPWLIVSLVASALAAFALVRSWGSLSEKAARARRKKTDPAAAKGGAAGPAGTAPERPGQVWVVDGRPLFHRSGCAELTGLPGESIPLAQAVEDGFGPCPEGDPPMPAPEPAAPAVPAVPASAGEPSVWVVDGRPEF